MSTVTEIKNTYQARWGWHPCDYDTYLELKEYHALLLKAYCRHLRMVTWANKTVKRTGPKPITFPGTTKGTAFATYGQFPPRTNLYQHVLAEYSRARRPVAAPEFVTPLDLPSNWRQQLEELKAFDWDGDGGSGADASAGN